MPRTVNGVGTRFYGQCDWRRDASFQTTEWVVLMYVPVVPLKSLRVQQVGGNRYRVFEELPLSLSQVLRTYAFAVAYLLVMPNVILVLANKMNFEADAPARTLFQLALLGLILAAPFMVVKLLRSHALRYARAAPGRPGSRR